jgi:hypothetical protein
LFVVTCFSGLDRKEGKRRKRRKRSRPSGLKGRQAVIASEVERSLLDCAGKILPNCLTTTVGDG